VEQRVSAGSGLADSAQAWRIARSYVHPATCVPRRAREWAIGRAWPVDRVSVRVSLECSARPRDLRCLARQASIDRDPASDQALVTLPESAHGRAPEAAAFNGPLDPAKAAAGFNGPLDLVRVEAVFSDLLLDRVKTVAASSDLLDPAKAAAAFNGPLGPAKVAVVSRSDLADPMVDLIVRMAFAPIVPVIDGPTLPTARSLAAAIDLGDRTAQALDLAATGGRPGMVATSVPGGPITTGAGTIIIITIIGTMIGMITGTITTCTTITMTGITVAGVATGRTTGTCRPTSA
jgi:hypothetical protein